VTRIGTLFLIVGPSGVGKDSLIDGAREMLRGNPGFVFARREITRPSDAGGEDHVAVTMDDFRARRAKGGYVLHWEAHGLGYGVPKAILDNLAAGRGVILNGSRGALDQARSAIQTLKVIEVTVPPEVLRTRLEARGRENPEDIEARLARAASLSAEGDDVTRFVNDRPLAESVDAFVALLTG